MMNHRIILKFGTDVLSRRANGESSKKIDGGTIYKIAESVLNIKKQEGDEVVIITSGSALAGCYRNQQEFPRQEDFAREENPRQAYADCLAELAVAGTSTLSNLYERAFSNYGLNADYCLITSADLRDDRESPGIRRRINNMLKKGRVPVINTNDFATIEELLPKYGEYGFDDNDKLACLVAQFSSAQRLYFVTSHMLHNKDPILHSDAKEITSYSVSSSPSIEWGDKSQHGRGGMKNKVEAACRTTRLGIKTYIITLDMLPQIAGCQDLGTKFVE